MRYGFLVAVLLAACFSMAVIVEPRLVYEPAYQRYEGSGVQIAIGEARRLFASQFFSKADVYMHRGFYPSIFDSREAFESEHEGGNLKAPPVKRDPENHETERQPDWIERFSRSFYPSEHTHLGAHSGGVSDEHNEEECDHPEHDHAHDDHETEEEHAGEAGEGEVREILPWLKLSAELDPSQVETFVTGAYWLRTRLGKPKEAEAFLRDGLRANPGSYAILFELGRVFEENYQDRDRARNVWEFALRRWKDRESGKEAPDTFMLLQIVWHLALVEEQSGNYEKAISYLKTAKQVSPNPEQVQQRIEELEQKTARE